MTLTHRQRDRGQATVEFAIVLPVVAIALLVVLQVAVVISDQLAVELAAREAARAAAVSGAPASAARQAVDDRSIRISTSRSGSAVTATASRQLSVRVPLIGAAIGDVTVDASATMQLEPP